MNWILIYRIECYKIISRKMYLQREHRVVLGLNINHSWNSLLKWILFSYITFRSAQPSRVSRILVLHEISGNLVIYLMNQKHILTCSTSELIEISMIFNGPNFFGITKFFILIERLNFGVLWTDLLLNPVPTDGKTKNKFIVK